MHFYYLIPTRYYMCPSDQCSKTKKDHNAVSRTEKIKKWIVLHQRSCFQKSPEFNHSPKRQIKTDTVEKFWKEFNLDCSNCKSILSTPLLLAVDFTNSIFWERINSSVFFGHIMLTSSTWNENVVILLKIICPSVSIKRILFRELRRCALSL